MFSLLITNCIYEVFYRYFLSNKFDLFESRNRFKKWCPSDRIPTRLSLLIVIGMNLVILDLVGIKSIGICSLGNKSLCHWYCDFLINHDLDLGVRVGNNIWVVVWFRHCTLVILKLRVQFHPLLGAERISNTKDFNFCIVI